MDETDKVIFESRAKLDNLKQCLKMMRYVNDNRCGYTRDFLAAVLADIRAGSTTDWYDRFFNDSWFQCLIHNYCTFYHMGWLQRDIRNYEKFVDDETRRYKWLIRMRDI
ncbi:MAG: hypothetical protein HDQ88_00920 [Clostridia bacterium]|nr:hypothetical protein [Clostridia bacterium]